MNPKLLLSTSRDDPSPYVEAVQKAGGEPTALYCPEFSDIYDGLILCGGADVHPQFYGQQVTDSVNMDLRRDKAEMALIRAFLAAGKPIFGICRGCQILNVYFGGTLHQHLDAAHIHAPKVYGNYLSHDAIALPGSICHRIYGQSFPINSHHHQGIATLAPCLKATMLASDGAVVEAVEHESLPVSAVQWHPEKMCLRFARPDTVDGLPILCDFVVQCK